MRTVPTIWRGEIQVPEPLATIAARVCLRYQVGIRDLRAPTRGSRTVCEARRIVMAEAAADGHMHKTIGHYLNRTRADVSHAVRQWTGCAA